MDFRPTKLIVVTGLLSMGKQVVMSILDKLSVFQYTNTQDYTFHLIELEQIKPTPDAVVRNLSNRFIQFSEPRAIVGTSRLNQQIYETFFDAERIKTIAAQILKKNYVSVQEAWFEFYRQIVPAFRYQEMLKIHSESVAIFPRKIEPTMEKFEKSLEGYKKYFDNVRYVFCFER